jgi:hypothetical protein
VAGLRHPATSADLNARFELLATAIAGVAIRVDSTGCRLSFTDCRTIFISSALKPEQTRTAVVMQAALIAGGALDRSICRKLSRQSLRRRYLVLEVDRALRTLSHELPRGIAELAVVDEGLGSASAADSLRLARSRARLPEPSSVFGDIRVDVLPSRNPVHANGIPESVVDMETASEQGQRARGEPSMTSLFLLPADGGSTDPAPLRPSAGPLVETAGKTRWGGPGTHPLTAVTAAQRSGAVSASPHTPGAEHYPEWDEYNRCYLPEHCRVREYRAASSSADSIGSAPSPGLRMQLSRLGLGFEVRRGQTDGDDLDIDGVIRRMVDRRAGWTSEERAYLGSRKTKPDLAVLMLIDLSGSIRSHAGPSDMHVDQLRVATRLTAAFHAVGHRVAVCGFRSYGRTDVRIILAKGFSELATESVYRQIAALHPAGFTRLGAVVRHGTSKLLHESAETHRLLLVVSDGVAFDHGYERPYGRADTRRALAEARAAGIARVCLTVGGRRTHTEGAFTSAEHLQVAIPEHIDPVFCRVVRRALLDVGTSRSGRVA